MGRKDTINEFDEISNSSERLLARVNKKFMKTVKDLDDFDIRKTLDVNEYMRDKVKQMKKKKYD